MALSVFPAGASTSKKKLSSLSWKQISKLSKSGLAKSVLTIGDKKEVVISGETYNAVLIGLFHDHGESGPSIGTTFMLESCLSTKSQWAKSNNNYLNWGNSSCVAYQKAQETVELLPEELQAVLTPVQKLTAYNGNDGRINKVVSKIFLFSEVEITGTNSVSHANEGRQYEFFVNGGPLIKTIGPSGAAGAYWLRSPYNRNATDNCYVTSTGEIRTSGGTAQSMGLAFAFCV